MNFDLRSGNSASAGDQYQQRIMEDTMAMIGVFIKDAAELAGIYCSHSKRNSVTVKDMELALKTRAFYGDVFWNRPDIKQKITEMKQFLNEPGSESESGSEYEYDEEEMEEEDEQEDEEMEEEEEETPFIQSVCTCEVCKTLNEVNCKWDNWHPTEMMNVSLKRAVETTFPDNL